MAQKFRVYIEQVNQTYVEVTAKTKEKAAEKGYRKWKKEDAHSSVISVSKIEPEIPSAKQNCQIWPNCSCLIRGNKLECAKHINSIRPI